MLQQEHGSCTYLFRGTSTREFNLIIMPTLDKRLLGWTDSDTEDDEERLTADAVVEEDARYDRRCDAVGFVDDVLVPGSGAGTRGRARPSGATRKVNST